MNRREFVSLLGRAAPAVAVTAALGGGYAVGVEPEWLEVRRVRIPVKGLDPALEGLRLVQLSDIHRSAWVAREFIERAVKTAVELRPELILLTGDYITKDAGAFEPLGRELASLGAAAPMFATMGNHDYIHYYAWEKPALPRGAEFVAAMAAAAGGELLRNETRRVAVRSGAGAVDLVALDDFWAPTFDAKLPFGAGSSAGVPRIVLSHNPDSFRQVRGASFDLMLAGHTHGGQVSVPLIGPPLSPVEDRRFIAGLVAADGRLVYVNRGLGFNRRVRFGVRPEITLLELTRAA